MKDYLEIKANCVCGCGREATQIFREVPIAEASCYATYLRYLRASGLEHFTSIKQFETARRLQTC